MRRRWFAAALAALAVVLAAGVGFTVVGDAYSCSSSKGVDVATVVDSETVPTAPGSGLPSGTPAKASTPEQALSLLASSGAPAMTDGTIPAQGWVNYRGRWVHEVSSDSFYEAALTRTDDAWRVNSYKICAR